jgi:hypothetical protein
LLVEELVQGDGVGDHMVQKVFLMAAPFQVPHAGLLDLHPDGRGKKPHRCGNEVFLEDLAQVAESLSDGQGIGIPMLKSYGSHSPRLDVGVVGASGDGNNHPTTKSVEVFVLSAVVPWHSVTPRRSRELIKRWGKPGSPWQMPWVQPFSAI